MIAGVVVTLVAGGALYLPSTTLRGAPPRVTPGLPTPGATADATSTLPAPTTTPATTRQTPIHVDHRAVAQFERMPDAYVIAAAALRHLFVDRSVGANIDDALTCLSYPSLDEAPSRCRRHEHVEPVFSVDPARLAWARPDGYDRSAWVYAPWRGSCGAWYDLVDCFAAMVDPVAADFDVVSFDFSYLEVMPGSTIAGDRGFFAPGTAHGGIRDLEALEARHPEFRFVLWTTSLARAIGSEESETFNEQMRAYAAATGRPLFDLADILSHDPDGEPCYDNRDGVPYRDEDHPDDGLDLAAICQHYTTESEGGHLGSVSAGGNFAAKAFWVLMARLAGWGGQ